MPHVPLPGSVTICEINRVLVTADNFSDVPDNEIYGDVVGMHFKPVPFEPCEMEDTNGGYETELHEIRNHEEVRSASFMKAFIGKMFEYFPRKLSDNCVNLLREVSLDGVSWHQHKNLVAFISGRNQVTICDCVGSDEKSNYILTSESQRDVKVLQWRPNSGKTLSVGCSGGICIWSASPPGDSLSVRRGPTAKFLGSVSKGIGFRWALVDFLPTDLNTPITAIAWSPNGRFIVYASCQSPGFTVFDFAQGLGTPIRRGFGGISLLKWSPTGDYFFSANFNGAFYLWEANTWTSELWSTSSSFVTGASWDPDGRMLLLSFSGSLTLAAIHLASRPPALDAHLLPVDLPEITSLEGSQGIDKIAWDSSGERLAVSFKTSDDLYRGLIAIYDVRRNPLISTSLVGFIRGPGENPLPVYFSFHSKFKLGALLSVCWSSGFCCTYPLIIRAHDRSP